MDGEKLNDNETDFNFNKVVFVRYLPLQLEDRK